ncbi:MAG: 3-deoxy-8-phosphooctulonate synthase [Candidatus Omnitrophica bacterium]|nr:3-deoxy-8-phosphooctulonate synthase [Candidatus Omnitrophota bacterium]
MPNPLRVLEDVLIGEGRPLALIAGPDVVEGEAHALEHAAAIRDIARSLGLPYVYKSSYDKANRTSGKSFRGPGIKEGLAVLKRVKQKVGVPVLSDCHSVEEVRLAQEVLDCIQIPAFLSRQTDLLYAAAESGRVVNIKKGQFLAPWDMKHVVEKVLSRKNNRILLTERGTSFGYNNLVSDMRSLLIMRSYGFPVIYDATHSIQLPGGKGDSSGGERRFVAGLARAACGAGCDGLFLEVHRDPDHAPCDGANMLPLAELEELLREAKQIHEVVMSKGRVADEVSQ